MRFTTIAALAAATTVYAQDQSSAVESSAPSPSSAGSGPASVSPPPTPVQSSLGATASSAGNGTSPSSGSGAGGVGALSILRNLSPQCQQGVIGLFLGGESAKCLQASTLLQALSGQVPSGAGPRPGVSGTAIAATSKASTALMFTSSGPVRRQEAVTSAASVLSSAVNSASNVVVTASPVISSSAVPEGTAPAGSRPTGNANSIIPGLEVYLQQACAAPGCSNSTITQIAETVLNSCQVDLQGAGISNETVQIIAQLYPAAREAACLQTTEAPIYDPTAFAPYQEGGANGTSGSGTASSAIPSAATSGPVSASSMASPSASMMKRQEQQGAPPEGAAAVPSVTASTSASPMGANATAPAPTGPMNGTAGTNSTIPAGNSTANSTFCATSLLKGLEEWHGKNLTVTDVLQLVFNSTERAKLSTYPAANLCNECVYAAVSIAETGAPWLLEQEVAPDTSFEAWYAATCPAANASISANGTLPNGVMPTAKNSTFGFPLTYTNTTGQETTTTPNATVTPIGQSANGTGNGTASAWPWPESSGNATAPLPTGPVNGTAPTPSVSDAAPSGAASSDAAAPEPTADGETAPAAESSAAPARRHLRFAREY
ncbi:hypothetical protein CC85DRAFT_52418 [Cutaneotrichosporon oleaginosum]|uniref:Uncharacterized protein n=1 Tax=Cutaneotrichosporon oleaginosum TaxID=879819 RepID=A0A0J1B6S4_9TREE|nr:uncharacterized protein CC85DRAFT_52418 [Cutaneotrichosporon oleaginosum]KLT43414.1 hypothetical protein CC85DRAFT_52418 [Cutaneotrichosporon oleaginosum]TXT05372.1 hypothetical protein COLE_06692 [Cutaneotrichosporon oleaginosum]